MTNRLVGIILYIKKIKDNDLFIKVLSSEDNINSGVVYGGNSSKKKLIYQNGFFINYTFNKKNEYSPPVFNSELNEPYLGIIFDDKYKLSALLSILGLLNISILEGQKVNGIYLSAKNLIYKIIDQDHWIINYIDWLFDLLQFIGYQVDFKNNINKKFYNISTQTFSTLPEAGFIEFPHSLFLSNSKLNYKNINSIFSIFEKILLNNHLDNLNYKLPLNYISFKKLVLKKLN